MWKASYLNEWSLMWHRKKMIAFAVTSTVLPIVLAVSLQALQPFLGLLAVGSSFPIELLSIYTGIWIPLFLLTVIGDLFPHEYASRTLKLALLRPNSRLHVFVAKAAVLGTAVGGLLAVLAVVTLLCSLFAGIPTNGADLWSMLKAYTAAFVAMLALSAVFVFAAQFFKSAGGFMVFALILYALAKLAPFLSSTFAAFSPTAYTDWHMLWLSSTVPAGRLLTAGAFLLSSCLFFFSLGYYKFERKEV
ncbi:ABC transporter permease [Paenibacillus athensensis]|uniref:Uncharacterized protein n=1 Tax=Paenibacillus athensensis TaxID=1967502 RepID=A0A4Y8QAY7_9BACL|nr:ABC transporter permease [Paenibacillus athensensis]MCD1257670.1 ABC transporter permease [Paenibacillus athensensis]